MENRGGKRKEEKIDIEIERDVKLETCHVLAEFSSV
jgi:hypothetical protein